MFSTITLKQIFSDVRMLVEGEHANFSDPSNSAMLAKYNDVVPRIFKMLNGARASRFVSHAPLGTPAAYLSAIAGDNRTYTASTKRITNPSVTSAYVGALCLFSDNTNEYFAYVTAVTASTDFTVSDGPAGNIAAGSLRYILFRPPSGTSHSVDGYRMDALRSVHFTTTGNASRKNEDGFEGLSNNSNMDSSSAVLLTGSGSEPVVKTFTGSSGTTGWPIAFFDDKPKVADDVNEYVGLPEEFHGPLIEEMARLTLLDIGAKIPKSLENPLLSLMQFSDAWQAVKDTYATNGDTPT